MKKTQIVATLAFAFVLGISIPITHLFNSSSAHAAEQTTSDPELSTSADQSSAVTQVGTEDALKTAIADENISQIQLTSDLTLESSIRITRTNELTLDLNSHTITSPNGGAMAIYQGKVNIIGQGVIDGSTRGNAIEVYGSTENVQNYSVVSVGQGVTLKTTSLYGLSILPARGQSAFAYGIVINFAGKIESPYGASIRGTIQHLDNAPQINILDGAEIISTSAEDGTPIYAAGNGNWTIGKATLQGEAAIGIKAGTMTFNNTTVQVTGPEQIVNLTTGKIIGTGSTFQLEHNPAYADHITLNINGGTYSSAQSHVFYEYDDQNTRAAAYPADINITGGNFIAGSGKNIFQGFGPEDRADIEISGGTFKGEGVANFKQNGYLVGNLNITTDGTVYRPSYNRPSSDVEAPEDPSDSEAPSDPTPTPDRPQDENKVPDTGLVSDRGIISAVSTIAPLLIAGGFAFMFFSGKIHERERQRRLASIESEINAEVEQIIDESEPEPTIDRFIAVPIDRDEPTITPVDPFVPHR